MGRSMVIEESVFELYTEIAKYPTTLKVWRSHFLDWFNDTRFFSGPPTLCAMWKPIILSLFSLEKERFVELIGISLIIF